MSALIYQSSAARVYVITSGNSVSFLLDYSQLFQTWNLSTGKSCCDGSKKVQRFNSRYENSPFITATGCKNFVAMDGIWKLRHPHCMYPVKAQISGLPLVNYPNVCTNEPESQQSAFCSTHALLASKLGIPTNLREFVHDYCKVEKRVDGMSTVKLKNAIDRSTVVKVLVNQTV